MQRLLADPVFLRNLVGELTWKLREATAERAWRYRSDEILFGTLTAHASRELVQEVLATGHDGALRKTEVVTLFADIRGFTATSGRTGCSPRTSGANSAPTSMRRWML